MLSYLGLAIPGLVAWFGIISIINSRIGPFQPIRGSDAAPDTPVAADG